MRMFLCIVVFIILFPLVGGVNNTPASPSALISGLSLQTDEQEFEIIDVPTSPIETHHDNDDDNAIDDNERASTITESDFTMPRYVGRTRQNSIPSSTFSTLRTAIFNGISDEKQNINKSL